METSERKESMSGDEMISRTVNTPVTGWVHLEAIIMQNMKKDISYTYRMQISEIKNPNDLDLHLKLNGFLTWSLEAYIQYHITYICSFCINIPEIKK